MAELKTTDGASVPLVSDKHDRSFDGAIIGMHVLPSLPLSINSTLAKTIEVDVLSAPEPPSRLVLVRKLKVIGNPVLDILAKADGTSQSYINVLEEA